MKPTPITNLPEHLHEYVRRRIADRTRVTERGCWEWTALLDRYGYGKFRVTIEGVKRTTGAHRASWLSHRGEIPAGMQIDHLCRNRACVNPEHLDVVTNRENSLRSIAAAGPGGRGRRTGPRRDECRRGHPLSGENLHVYTTRAGYVTRICIACRARRFREWTARQAA